MRIARLITWLCTAFFAGIAALYAAALLHSLLNGRMAEFSKGRPGRSYAWADSPGLMVVSTLAHAMLLTFLVMFTIWMWRSLPSVLIRVQRSFAAMKEWQRAVLCTWALTLIATLAAMTFGLPTGTLRRPTVALIWLLWSSSCAQLPLWTFTLGEIGDGVGRVLLRRSDDPERFWFRWITATASFAFILGLATFVSWVLW